MKIRCIEHFWIDGSHDISTVFKLGSYSRLFWVCEICGKRKLKLY